MKGGVFKSHWMMMLWDLNNFLAGQTKHPHGPQAMSCVLLM